MQRAIQRESFAISNSHTLTICASKTSNTHDNHTDTNTFAVDVQNATDVLTLLFGAVQSGTAFFQTQKNEEV